jgi:polysaccharide deacetylase 2 family uncharacterized protein YibQ
LAKSVNTPKRFGTKRFYDQAAICSTLFFNHKSPKIGQDYDDSGQTVLWNRIQQLLELYTGPTVWPVSAGLAVGDALLVAVFLSQPPAKPVPSPQSAAKLFGGLPEKAPVTQIPSSQMFLLPPRPGASDVTRRIENGLPRRDPAGTSSVKQPPTKHQTTPTQTARTTPVKLLPAVTKPSPGRVKARRPRIAVVIDDMGFDRNNSTRALGLPPKVTLAYLPFAPGVATQVRRARLKGHPGMRHLPMEAPDHGGKPGANVLSVASGLEKLRRQLTDILGRFRGYTGVNNHVGSKFTRDRERMDIVVSELKRRGLNFLDSQTSGSSVGTAAAVDAGIAYSMRDVFLDHAPDRKKILTRIAETEWIARQMGRRLPSAIPAPRR